MTPNSAESHGRRLCVGAVSRRLLGPWRLDPSEQRFDKRTGREYGNQTVATITFPGILKCTRAVEVWQQHVLHINYSNLSFNPFVVMILVTRL